MLADAGADVDVVLDYLWGEPVPSAALRVTRLATVGSGQGSVSPRDIVAELSDLAAEVGSGRFTVQPRTVPLEDVHRAWTDPRTSDRLVVVP
ncbi:MAG: hypothetical protein ACRYG2_27945 [Janthinobacterium lividum]